MMSFTIKVRIGDTEVSCGTKSVCWSDAVRSNGDKFADWHHQCGRLKLWMDCQRALAMMRMILFKTGEFGDAFMFLNDLIVDTKHALLDLALGRVTTLCLTVL